MFVLDRTFKADLKRLDSSGVTHHSLMNGGLRFANPRYAVTKAVA
jgi:hypothetical protein